MTRTAAVTSFVSSTAGIPEVRRMPRHVAVIMDGNGRWAKQRYLPRVAGHKQGAESVRTIVRACGERGIEYPDAVRVLERELAAPGGGGLVPHAALRRRARAGGRQAPRERRALQGDRRHSPLSTESLVRLIRDAEALTAGNRRLTLTVAANYGGRWDVLQAVRRMLQERPALAAGFGERDLAPYLSLSYAPEPDLFIRTGGEQRISNFVLWQLAYTELYFTDTLWPDFDAACLDRAIISYQQRERRFGRTSEQLPADAGLATLRLENPGVD